MIIKRGSFKIYHPQGANTNGLDRKIDSNFGKTDNFTQTGNAFIQVELILKKNGGYFEVGNTNTLRLINNALADPFKEATIITNGGSGTDRKKIYGPVFTIMRVLTSEDGDSFIMLDDFDGDNNNSLEEILFEDHTIHDNKRKIFGELPLQHNFRFCKTFQKVAKA